MKGAVTPLPPPQPILWGAGGTRVFMLEGTHISSIVCPRYWNGELRALPWAPSSWYLP